MKMRQCIFFMLVMSVYSEVSTQEYSIEITLSDVAIVQECHFGDEWSAYFSFGGEYMYRQYGDPFILKPNEAFGLTSMIFEGNERHNDYEERTLSISYEDLKVGRYKIEEELYIEDENTGRYHCNNATFRFSYIIDIARR